MNIKTLKEVLPHLVKNDIVPFIWGQQGIGKSATIKQVADELQIGFVHLHLATQEVGDLVGLLIKRDDGTVEHARPEWFPTSGSGIVFLDECFPGNTQIATSNGIKSLKQVYTDFQDGKTVYVQSFNEKTKKFENKKVTNAWNKGKKEVIGLQLNNTKKITCTPNHPILTDNGYVKAEDLVPGTKVLAKVVSKEKTCTPALNADQLQVAYGLILGDGSLCHRRNGSRYISNIHGIKQEEYIEYKASLFSAKTRYIEKNGYAQTPAKTFHTRLINEFYGMKKEQVLELAIKNLSPKSLSIWFQDDGSKGSNSNTGALHTEGMSERIRQLCVDKLNSMGYTCNSQKSGEYSVIYITATGFKNLSKDIAKYVVPSMRYKLCEEDRNVPFEKMNSENPDYGYYTFTKFGPPSTRLDKNKKCYVYDIEVEDNHNFVVCSKKHQNGIVVHNCNRAHPDVIQSIFSFITSKTIHRHVLPPGWKIIAAGNYDTDEFQVTNTQDAAWMSRFCHIELQPTAQEFVSFAEKKNAMDVANFISEHPEALEVKKRSTHNLNITPDRRAWLEMAAPLETVEMEPEVRMELYSGIVGPTAAALFMNWKKTSEKRISIAQVLGNYKSVRKRITGAQGEKETRFDLLSAVVDELLSELSENKELVIDKNYGNLVAFLSDIPLELLLKTVKRLGKLDFALKTQLMSDAKLLERLEIKK